MNTGRKECVRASKNCLLMELRRKDFHGHTHMRDVYENLLSAFAFLATLCKLAHLRGTLHSPRTEILEKFPETATLLYDNMSKEVPLSLSFEWPEGNP